MRRIVFAPSFDDELFEISASIQAQFGSPHADEFELRIKKISRILAHSPLIGTLKHGYPTKLYGMVHYPNWLFYRFTDTDVQFLHIRDGRRGKDRQAFLA